MILNDNTANSINNTGSLPDGIMLEHIEGKEEYTISLVVKPIELPCYILSSTQGGGTGNLRKLFLHIFKDDNNQTQVRFGGRNRRGVSTSYFTEAIPNYKDGDFYDITITYKALDDIASLYIDTDFIASGQAFGSKEVMSGGLGHGGFRILGYQDSRIYYPSKGFIDEIRFWNRALTSSEVKKYKAYSLDGNEDGLVAYFQFEDLDNPMKDTVNRYNDGNLNNLKIVEEKKPLEKNKYLFRKDNIIYQPTEEGLKPIPVSNLTKEDFDTYGSTDLSWVLQTKGELLISQDILSETIPKANIKGYTSPQLVKPTGDIRFNRVKSIRKLEIKGKDSNSLVKIVFSLDEGNTWLSKKNVEGNLTNIDIDIENLDNIKENGMTISEFNAINEKWSNEIISSGKIRFAYYLELDDINTVSEVDDLIATIDKYGYWRSIIQEDEFDYHYTNESLSIHIYKNGAYKINYIG